MPHGDPSDHASSGLDHDNGESRAGERAVIVLIGIMAAVALILSAVNLLGPEPLLGGREAVGFGDSGVSSAELARLERRVAALERDTEGALTRAAADGEPGASADLARAFADLRAQLERRVSRLEEAMNGDTAAVIPAATPSIDTGAPVDPSDAGALMARIEALEWRVDTFNNLVAPDFAGEIGRQRDCLVDLQTDGGCLSKQ